MSFIGQHQGVHRTHIMLQLASKLVSQCEVQVVRLHSFAFPLAEVAVSVAAVFPDFMALLLAKIHQVMPDAETPGASSACIPRQTAMRVGPHGRFACSPCQSTTSETSCQRGSTCD